MGRRRIELTHAQKTEIAARTARGESAQTIRAALGNAVSVSTIERRQRELKGTRSDGRTAPVSKSVEVQREPDAAEAPDDDPDADRAAALADELGAVVDRMIDRAVERYREGVLEVLRKADAERATLPPCPHCGVRSKPAKT